MQTAASLHYFPRKPKLRKQWQHVLKIGKTISKYMAVCSLHFKETDYHANTLGIKRHKLKMGVISSKNIPIGSIKKKEPVPRKIRTSLQDQTPTCLEVREVHDILHDQNDEQLAEPASATEPLFNLQLLAEICADQEKSHKDIEVQCCIIDQNMRPIQMILRHSEETFKINTGVNMELFKILVECAVYWPSFEENKANMPSCFHKYSNTRVVLDCTEIPVQAPRCLKCRTRSYSYYKCKHTLKYMIGVTPAGTISFISSGYGGRTSDKAIFNDSDIISKLEPYVDAVMVDKGFHIEKETREMDIQLIRPPFLRSEPQLSKKQVEMTADIAQARIHVERAIQRLKFFNILSDVIPWTMAPYIDDAIVIIASLTNLSHPIFKNDQC